MKILSASEIEITKQTILATKSYSVIDILTLTARLSQLLTLDSGATAFSGNVSRTCKHRFVYTCNSRDRIL
jgi:hypothetical protein